MEYEIFYTDANDMPSFPKTYPTGVLLGRVELTDVISLD